MGDLRWIRRHCFTVPLAALQHHIVCLGNTGSGKTETMTHLAYGGRKVYNLQVALLDAKGEEKSAADAQEDTAARFVAAMHLAGATRVKLFPATYYNGWLGSPTALVDRLLSVIDLSESAYYRDVAAHILNLALRTPVTPRSSAQFLANLHPESLEAQYQQSPRTLERVRQLDRRLLQEVRMRYDVFFSAVRGQLDGTLSFEDADAIYLRIQGFALRQEAPRLGRFLVHDFMHYIAKRRQPGVRTLLIIDEFGALELGSDISILFEQVRSFGGCLVIAAQGYASLGPEVIAKRILDAAGTYVLHRCSDPFPVAKRAGKRQVLETSWSEEQGRETGSRQQIHTHWEWKVPENAVMQQETGQAYWINQGKSQQVLTARIPMTDQQVQDAWQEIRTAEEEQRRQVTQRAQARSQTATGQTTAISQSSLLQLPLQGNTIPGQKRSNSDV